ncbi:MAG: hypothetical protein JWM11_972 [Planctomycetaceae bacterium]|nr:hypothetical protein [Planctomycetaceae bacterium]
MSKFNRLFWRAAGSLQRALEPPTTASIRLRLADSLLTTIPELTERLNSVQRRGWSRATTHVRGQVLSQLRRFHSQIQDGLDAFNAATLPSSIPTQKDLYDEFVALADEFEEYELDLKKRTISVVTESIVMDDIELGQFRIRLDWSEIPNTKNHAYAVEALTPCHPSSSHHITHPHVTSNCLCEGDATVPIRQALRSGRLTDFFQIVDVVLHTYNGDSPYATLSEWRSVECHSCGQQAAGDADYCSYCRDAVCESCWTSCQNCDESRCDACIRGCSCCDESICPNCLKTCLECDEQVCPTCLHSKTLCKACHAQTKSETPDTATNPEFQTATSLQSAGLGQIAVLA